MTALTHVAARPDGVLLAVSSSDGWLGVWMPIDNRIVATQSLGAFINKIGWMPDGAYLLATVRDELVVLSADGTQRIATVSAGHGALNTFATHPSKPLVATTGGYGVVNLWELPSGKPILTALQSRASGSGGGTSLALSEHAIVVGYDNGNFGTCNPDGSNTGGGQVFGGPVASLAVVPKREGLFMAGGGRGRLAMLLINDEKMMVAETWSDPPKPIAANTIDFAPDGRFVVACSDNTALAFSSSTDKGADMLGRAFWLDKKPWEQDYIVSAACFVPKTKVIATSHFTGCVKLWRSDKSYRAPVEVTFDGDQVKWAGERDPIKAWPTLET